MQERRRYRRKLISSRVRVYHPAVNAFETKTKDISNGGILISVKESYVDKIRVKDTVKVVFFKFR